MQQSNARGRLKTGGLTLCLSLLGAAGFLACDHRSPTEPSALPPASASGLSVVLQDDSGPLVPRFADIRRQLEEVHESASRLLPISGITVVVSSKPELLATGWGVTGSFSGGTEIDILIQPQLPDVLLAHQLPFVAAHEFHHVARSRGPGYGFGTLLEAMVSEGLADHFAAEHVGPPVPPWAMALSPEEIDLWLARARLLLDSHSYGHDAWFFGASPQIPRWTGYTLGYELVSRYQASHRGATAASLWNTPAEEFRPEAGGLAGISVPTVTRRWRIARSWLYHRLTGKNDHRS
jgi:uncharacterized protein YjaZ